ncbi:uncharacterized protein LOC109827684 isoform X2 [Asparagus officinalis]|uniref:uncharacterized protein LOC109827684 isoform X2 n=1 Tax=Asparagus officinalis TaxID=4686 RepID=UPI00098E4C6B|nr:uncharacterized protein LOC109827684 isoform X2 [Asparagus officinalis]
MEEERNYSKLEEALEIKSLRRIISAYLNYSDAAEEDVRRYERSYKKLSPAHKALLCHLPLKYQRLRRCISVNTFFIMNMLQAFEPPIDMSQNIDIDEHENLEHAVDQNLQTQAQNTRETSIDSGQPFPSIGSEDSGPESYHIQRESNTDSGPSGRNNEIEIQTGDACWKFLQV